MQNTKLKSAKYFTPNNPDVHTEKYLVETQDDLNSFMKAFPENKQFLAKTLKEDLERGKIILLTDRTLSGFSSYCYETVLKPEQTWQDAHVQSFIRVQPVTRETLIDRIIECIKGDIEFGDTTVLAELLEQISTESLIHSLPEEEWNTYKSI